MGTQHQQGQHGFTIIETLLFLTVSAILAGALLTGWTAMINTQRYKDSNKALQTFLQQQYSLVYNVENGRGSDLSCVEQPTSVKIEDSSPANQSERGQSDCVVMGRYIHIENGSVVKVASIIGVDQEGINNAPTYTLPASDIESIARYKPTRSDFKLGETNNELEIPWQAYVVGEGDDTARKSYVIAVIRAPLTGIVHTFSKAVTGALPELDELATNENERELRLCLDPGIALAGGRQGVVIGQYAASQSAVKSLTVGSGICG